MQLAIPITKGGQTYVVDVDFDQFSEEVFREICARGARELLETGLTKVTKSNYPDQAEREGAAQALAQKNLGKMLEGDIKFTVTGKKKKAGPGKGAVTTEAMRMARAEVKEEMKRQGIKVSHVEPKEITRCAKEILEGEDGPEIWAAAEEAVAKRQAKLLTKPLGIHIQVSERKVKQAEEKAGKRASKAEGLSAKQAGMVFHTKPASPQPTVRH